MSRWQEFWHDYPAGVAEQDFLTQVCHTDGGRAYSPAVFDAMVETIVRALALEEQHTLLDIGCGNGVVTQRLAARCTRALGVDFSSVLLDVAKRYHGADNLGYLLCNALDLPKLSLPTRFDRICMYGALQHFEENQFDQVLDCIMCHAAKDVVVLIGAVPDAARKHILFDTPKKRAQHLRYLREGRDRMGTWWHRKTLANAAARAGLVCNFDGESPGRPGGHYRFDLQLTPVPR